MIITKAIKNVCIISILLGLASCTCGNLGDKPIRVIKATDKVLGCNQLDQEILETKTLIELNVSRLNNSEAFTKYPTCLPFTNLELEKNITLATNRLRYLENLKDSKKCSKTQTQR